MDSLQYRVGIKYIETFGEHFERIQVFEYIECFEMAALYPCQATGKDLQLCQTPQL